MTKKQKIDAIKNAIEKAEQRQSKLTPANMEVTGFVSLLGRHLYNNLGSISTRFLEIGSHCGCSFTSTVSGNNLLSATAIDNFASDLVDERKIMPIFLSNVARWTPLETKFKFIHKDSFEVDIKEVLSPNDFYIYDGSHDAESQEKAFTYYVDTMADEFITVVDDFDWEDVKKGTYNGIKKANLEILFEHILVGNDHDNEGAWNGYGIFLLRKK